MSRAPRAAARRTAVTPLDRYVFTEWLRVFLVTAVGFPLLVIVIDVTDKLDGYLARQIPRGDIALSYVYGLPDWAFQVLPAAVLFATVFAIGGFTRHSEITAAKASGLSFWRMIAPVFLGAAGALVLALGLGELAPVGNAKRLELLRDRQREGRVQRSNFAFASEHGRVYKIMTLNIPGAWMDGLEIERKGSGVDYPTVLTTAAHARWAPETGWQLQQGMVHVFADSSPDIVFRYDSLTDAKFREAPIDLLTTGRAPEEMRYAELGRFISALERSGGDANVLKVKRALRIAIPVTCVIIVLFGAPLATSTKRGGAAYGIGISLATTIIFLLMIQLTQAMGGKGLLPPLVAAWVPNALFGVVGAALLARVRT